MFEAIKQILIQTPWWVYLLLYVLIQRGIAASKTQVVPFVKMAIIPLIFTGLSIYTIVANLSVNALHMGTWIMAIIVGSLIGWRMLQNTLIRVDRNKQLIEIPGSWRTLILILVIFCFKYFFGYLMGARPSILQNVIFDEAMILVSGVCSGMFVGNFIRYSKHYISGPFTTLQKTEKK